MRGTKYLTEVFESSSREVPFIKAETKEEIVLEPVRENVFFTGVVQLVFHSCPVRTFGTVAPMYNLLCRHPHFLV